MNNIFRLFRKKKEPCICERECHCSVGVETGYLGMESNHFGDVFITKCPECGRLWLRYHWEHEGFTGSGQWYIALISDEMRGKINKDNAIEYLENAPWYWYGGSFWGTAEGKKRSGRLSIM